MLAFARQWEQGAIQFTRALQDHHSLLTQPLPSYSNRGTDSEREDALVHMLNLLVGHEMNKWWSEVMNRFHMVIFWSWFIQEQKLMGSTYILNCFLF